MKTDIVIVGTGVSGLYCALNLPRDKKIVMVTKADDDKSDSFLAQGGICVLKDENDYDSYFEDTMRAGHYENNKESVDIMIRSSRDVINDLVGYGVRFEKENGEFAYTKEGAHSTSRILFHEDITGKEITSHLLTAVKELDNVTIIENFTMVDIIEENNECFGIIGYGKDGKYIDIQADFTVFATGGIGGLYKHSTNYRLGGETGFLVGAITAFVSNFFFGQGPWTPWQMFSFGIIGFLAGIMFQKGILRKTKTAQ